MSVLSQKTPEEKLQEEYDALWSATKDFGVQVVDSYNSLNKLVMDSGLYEDLQPILVNANLPNNDDSYVVIKGKKKANQKWYPIAVQYPSENKYLIPSLHVQVEPHPEDVKYIREPHYVYFMNKTGGVVQYRYVSSE